MAARAPGAPARHAAGFLSKLSRRSFAEFLDRGPLVEAKFSHASKLPNFLTTHSAMSMKRPKPPSAASSLSSDDSDRMRDGSGSALLRRNRSPKKNCFGFLGCGGGGGSDALEPAAAPAASAAAAAYDAAAASDVDVVGGSVAVRGRTTPVVFVRRFTTTPLPRTAARARCRPLTPPLLRTRPRRDRPVPPLLPRCPRSLARSSRSW